MFESLPAFVIRILFAVLFGLVVVGLTGCASTDQRDFIHPMEHAHNANQFADSEAMEMDIRLAWGDNPEQNWSFVFETHGPRAKMTRADGATVIHDGTHAYLFPADANWPMARFHSWTWPWFMIQQFKLEGPGIQTQIEGTMMFEGKEAVVARTTFAPGTGDADQDWYVNYLDPETNLLAASAYIVTYGTPVEQASKNTKVVVYNDFIRVDGVAFATSWDFFPWSAEDGINYDDPRGHVAVSRVSFIEPDESTFAIPSDARLLELTN